MCIYILYNIIGIRPICPTLLDAAFFEVISLIAIWFAPTLRLRILGVGVVLVVSLFLAERLKDWRNVNQEWHKQADFTSSILMLSGRLKNYFYEIPDVIFTNVADYVGLGVVNSRDTAFLSNCSAVVIPPKLGGQELLVVEDSEKKVIISRYGQIQSWKSK